MSACASPSHWESSAPHTPVTATPTAPPVRSITAAGGLRFVVRAVAAGDRDAQGALFARMSDDARHMRFLTPKREFSTRELVFFTDVDHLCHEAFAAIDERDGSMVAVARYVCLDGHPSVAEVAAEVVDDLRGIGVGTALAELAIQGARANGIELLMATTLADNSRARALLHTLGFRVTKRSGRELELAMQLT
jgi:protein lysine acetyltransferase